MTDSIVISPARAGSLSGSFQPICILSSCHFSAHGLATLLGGNGGRAGGVRVLLAGDMEAGEDTDPVQPLPAGSRLIVFIPRRPVEALLILKRLALLLELTGPLGRSLSVAGQTVFACGSRLPRKSGVMAVALRG